MSEVRYIRPQNFPPVVKNLIIINVLVWVGQLLLDPKFDLTNKLMLWPYMPKVLQSMFPPEQQFNPYQLITYMFAHAPYGSDAFIIHIAFNMLALWMFGRILESVWGSKRFLIFYLICGIGAALFHLGIQYFNCERLVHAVQNGDVAAQAKLIGAIAPALGASGA